MESVGPAVKNECSAGKTSALLRGDASQANRCYVVAHCATPHNPTRKSEPLLTEREFNDNNLMWAKVSLYMIQFDSLDLTEALVTTSRSNIK